MKKYILTSMFIIFILIVAAAFLIYFGWGRIYYANEELVTGGIYKFLRHPQYLGFILITVALLIHWPTLLTVIMWPVLVLVYIRLAKERTTTWPRNTVRFLRSIKLKPQGLSRSLGSVY